MKRAETIIGKSLKRCLTCDKLKSFSEFSKHKGHYLGLQSQCKKCKAIKDKKYALNNKKKIREIYKRWASNNRDKINKASRNYWLKNRDKYRVAVRNRRARIMRAEGSFTSQEWNDIKKKFNYYCAICKKREPFDQFRKYLTIDHIIPISKGGTNYISNIQPLCFNCNSIKKDKD